ncbi:MAG: hypothetical protein ACETWR_04130 [Anaerolineae bacterium]
MEDSSTEKLAADLHEALADKEHPNLQKAMQLALADEKILKGILDGIVSKDEVYRYNCFKVLVQISESQPLVLYPEWDYFIALLDSSNAYHRSIAVQILANLTPADAQYRFEAIFDRYFDLLDDEKIIVTRSLVQSAGTIARAKPSLQARIVERLLGIDETHHKHKDLIKGDAIQSFQVFFEDYPDKERILGFVEQQLQCSSPKTRKTAKAFLDEHRG